MSLGRIDQEQAEFAKRRNAAIMNSGHEFVELKLIDITKRNVAGIDEVNAVSYMEGFVEKWHFNLQGGCAHFLPDESKGGAWMDRWVKTDRNMKFLASHYYDNPAERHWEIVDKSVEKEVAKIRKGMVQVAVETPQEIKDIRDQIKNIEHQLAICDQSQTIILREKKDSLLKQLDKVVEGITGMSGLVTKENEKKPSVMDRLGDVVKGSPKA